jgi:hypothetical protein
MRTLLTDEDTQIDAFSAFSRTIRIVVVGLRHSVRQFSVSRSETLEQREFFDAKPRNIFFSF